MKIFGFLALKSLRLKLYVIVTMMVCLIAANGFIAFLGVQRVYNFSAPMTVGFQLEQLEKAYKKGARTSLKVQPDASSQMKKASSTVYDLKEIVFGQIFMITFIFACLGGALGMMILNTVLTPLGAFSNATKKISKGNLDTVVSLSSPDEMGALAASFNEIIHSLKKSLESEKKLKSTLEGRVTERTAALKNANEDLVKSSEVKAEFLSNISHDLKTPLNSILGFTQLTLSDTRGELTELQRKNLNKVVTSARELLQMINMVLDFTKAQAGKLEVFVEEFSFETLLDECLESIEVMLQGKKVKLLKVTENHLPKLKTDRLKIKRVLLNLLSNAAKNIETGSIEVSVKRQNGSMKFAVSDTGNGIPAVELLNIFDESRSKYKKDSGSGLGLIITKRLVTVLGGTIDVHSEQGKGSVFCVKVPVVYKKVLQPQRKRWQANA